MQFYDSLIVDKNTVRETPDGYLAADARVARTGIQIYGGKEVNKPDMERVRVYRPENEVFAPDSIKSYAHRPVTNNHPPVPVSATNWRKYSVGHTADEVLRDGDFIRVPLVMMDSQVIKDYRDGKRQLSLGYTCDFKWESGKTPGGEEYDAVQTNIRANHLAVVKDARGGSELRIGDEDGSKKDSADTYVDAADELDNVGDKRNKGDSRMKTIVVDGISCEMSDTAAQVVQKMQDNFSENFKKAKEETEEEKKKRLAAEAKAATDTATFQTQIATKDTEIVTLTAKLKDATLTPQALDKLVQDRGVTKEKARAVLGDKLVVDGKTDSEIRRQVVDAKLGDVAKGWNEDQYAASFAAIVADVKVADGASDVANAFKHTHVNTADANAMKTKAYDTYDADIQNRWQNKTAA